MIPAWKENSIHRRPGLPQTAKPLAHMKTSNEPTLRDLTKHHGFCQPETVSLEWWRPCPRNDPFKAWALSKETLFVPVETWLPVPGLLFSQWLFHKVQVWDLALPALKSRSFSNNNVSWQPSLFKANKHRLAPWLPCLYGKSLTWVSYLTSNWKKKKKTS